MLFLGSPSASAETLEGALARAYGGNPTLGAQRASVRATDENVPRALALGRPRISATADAGVQFTESRSGGGGASLAGAGLGTGGLGTGGVGTTGGGGRGGGSTSQTTFPRGVGVQIDQTLFNGNRTVNSTRQAESQVLGSRETLRNTEQTVLFNGATAYMNVLRDTAILSLQRNNIEVIDEQLRQTRDRFNVGEVTRTDVAQAEARLAAGRSQVSLAESNLRASIALFRQVIGVEPRQLAPGRPLDRLLPRSIDAAVQIGIREHPAILSALHAVDVAELQVKVTEGELFPTVGLTGSATERFDTGSPGDSRFTAAAVARLTVPIYEGGEVYARVRQAKETVGQRRIEAEVTRDQVRATVISSWGQLEASRAQILAAQAQVQATEIALSGVREEARVGQRTTLDVLNAQQELLTGRVNLITAQRDRVVNSFAVVQAMGRLSTRSLGLNIAQYNAKEHFDQVKGLAIGLRTPDGR